MLVDENARRRNARAARGGDARGLTQAVPEMLVIEGFHELERVGFAIPQVDRWQLHTVEGVGLDHRIMRLIEESEARAGLGRHRQAIIADHVAREARGAAKPDRDHFLVVQFAQHSGAIGRFDHIGYVASGRNISDPDRHPVPADVEQSPYENPGIECDRFAGLKIKLRPGVFLHILEEFDQLLALVVGAGDVVPSAHVDPFELAEIGLDHVKHRIPGALERFEVLFAEIVEVDAVDSFQILFGQLVEREAEPRSGRGGIVFRHFAGRNLRIDAQAHVEILPRSARILEDQRGTLQLAGRIENHMVGQATNLFEFLGLVGGRIGRDLAIVELARQPRFPQARRACAVEIFAYDRRGRPHAEGLERGQHLDFSSITNIGQNLAIGAQLRRVDHESGALDTGEIEMGEGTRIACLSFHAALLPYGPSNGKAAPRE